MISIRIWGSVLLIAFSPSLASAGTLTVTMQPGGGEAVIITTAAFQDCQRRGINGWDTELCGGWETLSVGPSNRQGRFCVQAWWGGGGGALRFRQGVDMTVLVPARDLHIIPQPPQQKVFCR
jgi:hypothetical protein